MKSRILAVLTCFVILGLASKSNGAVEYQLNRSIGLGSVTGFITTDGTLGSLGVANILDWDLLLNNGTNTFNLFGPLSGNNSQLLINTTFFTATATNLFFDFSAPTGGVLFQNPFIGSSENWYAFEGTQDGIGGFASSENSRVGFSNTQVSPHSEIIAIATTGDGTTAPEPASLVIWGFGALGCAIGAYRQRGRD
jgi:hypothetical protein